jgi:hypothetical protein
MAKKLKAGMSATLKSEFTGFRGKDRLATYGYRRGETVTLISYDSRDESWRVCKPGLEAKHLEHIFVKRSQLIPGAAAQPEQGEHGWKVGDTLSWPLLNDGTPRHYYGHSHDDGWTVKEERFFIDDRTIEAVRIIEGRTGLLISGTKNIWVAVGDLPQKSKVTPEAEAPKKRMAECVNMSRSSADFTVGKQYEIVGEYDEFLTLIDDKGTIQSGMFRWRFKELTEDKLSQFLAELRALIEKFK